MLDKPGTLRQAKELALKHEMLVQLFGEKVTANSMNFMELKSVLQKNGYDT